MDRFEIEVPESSLGRINFRQWIFDVVSWDGILPLCIFAISFAVAQFVAQNQFPAELLMVALPIIGVLIRFTIGKRKILSNYCPIWFRVIQFVCLGVAVISFMAFDFFVVLGAFINKNAVLSPADWMVLGVIGAIYLTLVTCAMFPGDDRNN